MCAGDAAEFQVKFSKEIGGAYFVCKTRGNFFRGHGMMILIFSSFQKGTVGLKWKNSTIHKY